jgi:mRNA interferase MazF
VWRIRFDPAEGDEIKKVRMAVVISENAIGRLKLKIVVPITEWKPRYANYPWFVHLAPTPANGLTKDSGADAFQVKSISETRFLDRLGELTPNQFGRYRQCHCCLRRRSLTLEHSMSALSDNPSQALTGALSLVGNFFLNQPQLALTDPKGSLF